MRLFILGLGYSARHFVRKFGGSFSHVAGTVRDPAARDDLAGIEVHGFSGSRPADATVNRMREADVLLVSIPPGSTGDPALTALGDVLAAGRRKVVYLSTIGVYGDHAGGWVDESTPPQSGLDRARMRVAAEQAWTETAQRRRRDPAACRHLRPRPQRAGDAAQRYGAPHHQARPGLQPHPCRRYRSAIMAAINHNGGGIWNVCDDEPAPPQDVIAYAAQLMGVAPPAEEAVRDRRDVGDGAQLLCQQRPRLQRAAEARARRRAGLSDLSARPRCAMARGRRTIRFLARPRHALPALDFASARP